MSGQPERFAFLQSHMSAQHMCASVIYVSLTRLRLSYFCNAVKKSTWTVLSYSC